MNFKRRHLDKQEAAEVETVISALQSRDTIKLLLVVRLKPKHPAAVGGDDAVRYLCIWLNETCGAPLLPPSPLVFHCQTLLCLWLFLLYAVCIWKKKTISPTATEKRVSFK